MIKGGSPSDTVNQLHLERERLCKPPPLTDIKRGRGPSLRIERSTQSGKESVGSGTSTAWLQREATGVVASDVWFP